MTYSEVYELTEDDTIFIKGLPKKFFYNQITNKILFDPNLSSDAKEFLLKILEYHRNPKKRGDNWTKKRAMSYFKLTKYKIDKIYKELIAAGYLLIKKIYPHQAEDNTMDNAVHNKIYWIYVFNINPDKKELDNMITNENNTQQMKKYFNKKNDTNNSTKTKITNTEVKQEIDTKETNKLNNYYNEALTRYKNSYFCTLDTSEKYIIEMADSAREFINNNSSWFNFDDVDLTTTINFCWDLLVKTKAFNEKAFNSYRYSDKGNSMASVNTKALLQSYNTLDTYQPGISNIPYINNSKDGTKKFLVTSTIIIHNYIKLGFFDDMLPEFKDLLGLYRTLAFHPELTGLSYNKESYKLFDMFFKQNQENYNKKE